MSSEAAKKAWVTRRKKFPRPAKGFFRDKKRKGKDGKPLIRPISKSVPRKARKKVIVKIKLSPAQKAVLTRKARARGEVPTHMTEQLNGHGVYTHQWLVPSSSDPQKKYKVSVTEAGIWLCDCPAFKFQRGPLEKRKPCKHIKSVKV